MVIIGNNIVFLWLWSKIIVKKPGSQAGLAGWAGKLVLKASTLTKLAK